MSELKNHIYCPYFGSEFREKRVKNRVKRDFLVSLENYTVSLDSSLVFYLILTQNWTVKVICWISLAWPNLAYFYFAMAELGPFLFCLGPAQFGFGDFPKPMHWSLLRICLSLFWMESVALVRRIIVQILLKFYDYTDKRLF